jgi:hypothetical protein
LRAIRRIATTRAALAVLSPAALTIAGCGTGDDATARETVTTTAARTDSMAFRSAPSLKPPRIVVRTKRRGRTNGYTFHTPSGGNGRHGLLIADDEGQPIWHRSTGKQFASDLRVQRYKGEPVLTWWQGKRIRGWGEGDYVIAGSDYREISRVAAGRGSKGDLHDFVITEDDTALITIYSAREHDLRPVGGVRRGRVIDSIVQEVDIETGRVLLEWKALDHIGLRESYKPLPDDTRSGWDHFHVNSVDVDTDGNLLISARNTYTVYKVDRRTGEVIWRLGGKRSDFRMGRGTHFAWQHDARRAPDGTLSLFDNQASPARADESRALLLDVDERRMRVTRKRQYTHPRALLSNNKANTQVLSNGNVMVGWGYHPYFTEYSRSGRVLFDARFADRDNVSYRAYRFRWTGRPAGRPAVASRVSGRRMTVYASWNGATEVAEWRVLAGATVESVERVARGRRRGFETAVRVDKVQPCVAVEALDSQGETLGSSPARCR